MKKISICIPVLNEEKNIENTYKKIKNIFTSELKEYEYEFLFTDNDSSDQTEEILTKICNEDKKVKYVRFRSNLDYDKSILEGYKHCTGDAAIVIDCDLQDPPELFADFIRKWQEGYDLVYGIVNSRQESFLQNNLRKIYYKIMNINTDFNYPKNAHDFRLVDRKLINGFKDNNNLFPYIRGLTFSLSKNPVGIEYDRKLREEGKSKLGFYNSFTYAINAFLEETFLFSKIFRRITLISILIFSIFTILNIFSGFNFMGFTQTLIFGFLIFICSIISITCEYATRIYFQLKKTDRNIYKKKLNL